MLAGRLKTLAGVGRRQLPALVVLAHRRSQNRLGVLAHRFGVAAQRLPVEVDDAVAQDGVAAAVCAGEGLRLARGFAAQLKQSAEAEALMNVDASARRYLRDAAAAVREAGRGERPDERSLDAGTAARRARDRLE